MRIRPAPAATWDLFLAQQMTSFLSPPSPLGCKVSLSARSATQSGPKGCLPRKERASARSQGSPPQEGLLPLGHPPREGWVLQGEGRGITSSRTSPQQAQGLEPSITRGYFHTFPFYPGQNSREERGFFLQGLVGSKTKGQADRVIRLS
jgi:hypothetical protein